MHIKKTTFVKRNMDVYEFVCVFVCMFFFNTPEKTKLKSDIYGCHPPVAYHHNQFVESKHFKIKTLDPLEKRCQLITEISSFFLFSFMIFFSSGFSNNNKKKANPSLIVGAEVTSVCAVAQGLLTKKKGKKERF